MKRHGVIAVLAAIMVFASSIFCFADEAGLKLVSSYPENGQKNTSIENVGVKLFFSNPITSDKARKTDEKLVKIVNSKGKKIATRVLFSDKEDGMVLVVADNTNKKKPVRITNSETYTLEIEPGFMDDNGNTLGEKTSVEFSTYNQKLNNIINMAMMFVMFGGIMFVTLKQQKDQEAEKKEANMPKDTAFNPYREAKRTGKTVEEVKAEEAKRQEKKNKKRKKKEPEKVYIKHIVCADYLTNVYHVHAPRSIYKKEASKSKAKKGSKK